MKIFLLLTFIFLISLGLPLSSYAVASPTVTATASASGSPTGIDEQISKLKDKIQKRVEQLKLVEKRGIIGTVQEVVGTTKLTLVDSKGQTHDVDVDELTKFSSPDSKGTFGISDIQKGKTIGVIGLYNKESTHILARFIDVVSFPTILNGVITSIDKKGYNIHIATETSKDIFISHENFTKDYIWNKDSTDLKKTTFSKITEGIRIRVIGFPDVKDTNKILASRIILLPDIQQSPKISLPDKQPIAGQSGTITVTLTVTPSLPVKKQ